MKYQHNFTMEIVVWDEIDFCQKREMRTIIRDSISEMREAGTIDNCTANLQNAHIYEYDDKSGDFVPGVVLTIGFSYPKPRNDFEQDVTTFVKIVKRKMSKHSYTMSCHFSEIING